jgi:hypothetical protein
MSKNLDVMAEVMYEALGKRIGLLLRVSDFSIASANFNIIRRRDSTLGNLSFRQSPIEGGNAIIIHVTRESKNG